MQGENSRAWWNNWRYLSTMDQAGGSHSSALVANLLWGALGTCQTRYTFPVQCWLWRQVWGQVGRPVPGLESWWAQDVAKHGFSCNIALARSSDKHLRLNEIHEHWQGRCLHVRLHALWAQHGLHADVPAWLRITVWKSGLLHCHCIRFLVFLSMKHDFSSCPPEIFL